MQIHVRGPVVPIKDNFGWKFKQELTPSMHNIDLYKEFAISIRRGICQIRQANCRLCSACPSLALEQLLLVCRHDWPIYLHLLLHPRWSPLSVPGCRCRCRKSLGLLLLLQIVWVPITGLKHSQDQVGVLIGYQVLQLIVIVNLDNFREINHGRKLQILLQKHSFHNGSYIYIFQDK